jgi:hypothetical protein
VTVITQTPDDPPRETFPFHAFVDPSCMSTVQLTAGADLVFHNHITLRTAWPMFFIRRPWVVTHEGWIPRKGSAGAIGIVKRFVLRWSKQISISDAVAADIDFPSW